MGFLKRFCGAALAATSTNIPRAQSRVKFGTVEFAWKFQAAASPLLSLHIEYSYKSTPQLVGRLTKNGAFTRRQSPFQGSMDLRPIQEDGEGGAEGWLTHK